MFDRICRENGITHRLTKPRSPTTTGKVERFHQTRQRELLDDHQPFASIADAQAVIDVFATNTTPTGSEPPRVWWSPQTVTSCGWSGRW